MPPDAGKGLVEGLLDPLILPGLAWLHLPKDPGPAEPFRVDHGHWSLLEDAADLPRARPLPVLRVDIEHHFVGLRQTYRIGHFRAGVVVALAVLLDEGEGFVRNSEVEHFPFVCEPLLVHVPDAQILPGPDGVFAMSRPEVHADLVWQHFQFFGKLLPEVFHTERQVPTRRPCGQPTLGLLSLLLEPALVIDLEAQIVPLKEVRALGSGPAATHEGSAEEVAPPWERQ